MHRCAKAPTTAAPAPCRTPTTASSRDTFRYPDVGTLEEVQVRAVGNDAEVATAGINFIAAVKSGANKFSGFYLAQWEGKKLQSDNLDDLLRSQGITVGSPRVLHRDLSAPGRRMMIRARCWSSASAPASPPAAFSSTRTSRESSSRKSSR
jgi:hypothetical protein